MGALNHLIQTHLLMQVMACQPAVHGQASVVVATALSTTRTLRS
jgi:hypothetical protein